MRSLGGAYPEVFAFLEKQITLVTVLIGLDLSILVDINVLLLSDSTFWELKWMQIIFYSFV